MSERDKFDLTPQQYHAGLDKLWEALGVRGVQDEDVFTLCAKEIERLRDLKRTCQCSEEDQCVFARERDEARKAAKFCWSCGCQDMWYVYRREAIKKWPWLESGE